MSEKNEHRELIPCPCRASEASGARLAGHLHYQVACTQGGETVARLPRESCSSQTCRSGCHSSPSHLQAKRGRMQPERPLQHQNPVTTSPRDCVSHMQQVDPSSKKLKIMCRRAQVSVLILPSIKSHEYYFDLFAWRRNEWLSGHKAS